MRRGNEFHSFWRRNAKSAGVAGICPDPVRVACGSPPDLLAGFKGNGERREEGNSMRGR